MPPAAPIHCFRASPQTSDRVASTVVERSFVSSLPERVGEHVTLRGWVHRVRLQRRMQFLIMRDSSGFVQLVHARGEGDPRLDSDIDALKPESAVTVTGRVVADARVKLGGLEVIVDSLRVDGLACQPLPIDVKSSVDRRTDYRFLDLRRQGQREIFEVQTAFEDGMRAEARRLGFVELHSPKLMASASESGSEVFPVNYFDQTAYLAQSPQFYKQMAMAAGFERVYEVGPVFRAEPSFTTRHATEFTGVDVEMSWIDSVDEIMDLEEQLLVAAVGDVADRHGEMIEARFGRTVTVPTRPFPRRRLGDEVAALRRDGWTPSVPDKVDLDPDGERRVSARTRAEESHEFTFVTHYPVTARPFYHMRDATDSAVTRSFDLLWNGIEITTGAQREHRYDVLVRQAVEANIDIEGLGYYLDCFRYGCPPHGGFGLGLSRAVVVMLGLSSVRDAMFVFRGPNRLRP
jgi:nondiscriminating aspartyl-tRNA synthetase